MLAILSLRRTPIFSMFKWYFVIYMSGSCSIFQSTKTYFQILILIITNSLNAKIDTDYWNKRCFLCVNNSRKDPVYVMPRDAIPLLARWKRNLWILNLNCWIIVIYKNSRWERFLLKRCSWCFNLHYIQECKYWVEYWVWILPLVELMIPFASNIICWSFCWRLVSPQLSFCFQVNANDLSLHDYLIMSFKSLCWTECSNWRQYLGAKLQTWEQYSLTLEYYFTYIKHQQLLVSEYFLVL